MKTAKQATLEWMQDLPDDASMRAILTRIEYLARIEEGLAEADRGDVVPNKQVMEELRHWRPSSGR
jgi:predicted transcriptional regulator